MKKLIAQLRILFRTEKQRSFRYKIYNKILNYFFLNDNKQLGIYGFCFMVCYTRDYYPTLNNMFWNYPELYIHKPKKCEYNAYWFYLDEEGKAKRLEILEKAIIDTCI